MILMFNPNLTFMKPSIQELKPYSHKELSDCYGVCDKTLKKWLTPFAVQIGEKNGRYYTIAQVRVIFEKIGEPSMFNE